MAGSFSDYLEGKILDYVFSGASFTSPATLYVGLATATITDSTTGSTVTEPAGGSYARVAVTNNNTNFPAASGGSKSNGTAVTFPTASGSWGTVTYWFIADASSAGNILVYGDLTVSKAVTSGDTVSFASSTGLTITLA